MMQLLLMYRNLLRVNVVGYDYTGYGLSTQSYSPKEEHCYGDVEALIYQIRDVHHIPINQMVMFGKSLGSGPTVHIGSMFDVRGVIVESGFLSGLEVVLDAWLAYLLQHVDIFRNRYKMDKIRCPVLVMHGKQDEIVHFSHAEILSTLTKVPTYTYFIDAGHNDLLFRDFSGYIDVLKHFLDVVFQPRSSTSALVQPRLEKSSWCCV
jgi:pimeloyl-ACP methyl ester carboxylesterase